MQIYIGTPDGREYVLVDEGVFAAVNAAILRAYWCLTDHARERRAGVFCAVVREEQNLPDGLVWRGRPVVFVGEFNAPTGARRYLAVDTGDGRVTDCGERFAWEGAEAERRAVLGTPTV